MHSSVHSTTVTVTECAYSRLKFLERQDHYFYTFRCLKFASFKSGNFEHDMLFLPLKMHSFLLCWCYIKYPEFMLKTVFGSWKYWETCLYLQFTKAPIDTVLIPWRCFNSLFSALNYTLVQRSSKLSWSIWRSELCSQKLLSKMPLPVGFSLLLQIKHGRDQQHTQ